MIWKAPQPTFMAFANAAEAAAVYPELASSSPTLPSEERMATGPRFKCRNLLRNHQAACAGALAEKTSFAANSPFKAAGNPA